MYKRNEIHFPSDLSSAPETTTISNTSSSTTTNKNEPNKSLIYQPISEISSGTVTQLRQSFSVSDENTLNAIGEQRVEGLLEIFPQLSKEVRHRIVSKLQSSLQEGSQGESGSVQESTVSRSDSDITRAEQAERIMQSILSKPQKKTDFFRMAGVFKKSISLDDD